MFFATPLRPAQQTSTSARASQYKRKRTHEEPPDALDDAHDDEDAPVRDPNDALQIPAPPFPHAAPTDSRANLTAARVQQELAGLTPAIYQVDAASQHQPAGSTTHGAALRTTHVNVLSTVMHRCLLEGDYDRAARAWGMVLRTKAHGTPIEPRHNGLWGLGAELLLRRKEQPGEDEHEYSDEGFQRARDYYERLILQYPFRIFMPNAIDAKTFYPPLFSVWIMQVLERSRRARRQHEHTVRESSVDGDTAMTLEERQTLEAEIQGEELTGAREICQRLDQLVESPPYDKHVQLLVLRGHVGLWISDLVLGKPAAQMQDDDSDYDWESHEVEAASYTPEQRKECLEELETAEQFFKEAAKISDGARHVTRTDIASELRDIAKQIAKTKAEAGRQT